LSLYSASERTAMRIGTRIWNRQTVRVLIHIYVGNIKLYPACHDGIQGCGATPVFILNVSVDGGECSASHFGGFICGERVRSFFTSLSNLRFCINIC
jgi:hypothetical protein